MYWNVDSALPSTALGPIYARKPASDFNGRSRGIWARMETRANIISGKAMSEFNLFQDCLHGRCLPPNGQRSNQCPSLRHGRALNAVTRLELYAGLARRRPVGLSADAIRRARRRRLSRAPTCLFLLHISDCVTCSVHLHIL